MQPDGMFRELNQLFQLELKSEGLIVLKVVKLNILTNPSGFLMHFLFPQQATIGVTVKKGH